MKKILLILFAFVSFANAQPAARPFELPVSEKAFDIENRHLLEIGERALRPEDRLLALNAFYELRTKLSADFAGTSDYHLASVLLAETCLLFPKDSQVKLTAPNKGTVNATRLAAEILDAPIPETISQEVRILWTFVLARYRILQQKFADSSNTIAPIWETLTPNERLKQLADLYNWVLFTYTQALSAHAEEMIGTASAVDIWNSVITLCDYYKPNLSALLKNKSEEELAAEKVTSKAGEQLHRSPRTDVLEAEIVRLKTRALLMLKRYSEAETELKKPCMSLYGLERRLLSLVSIANQGRLQDAQLQFEQCLPDVGETITNENRFAPEWRQVLWTMFSMYYERKRFSEADEFLMRLEPLLSQGERLEWLKLRLKLFKSELDGILQQDTTKELNAEQTARVEHIHNQCMKYAVVFPETCQQDWADFLKALTSDVRPDYYNLICEVLLLLGKAQCLTGNYNSAFELFEKVGQTPVFGDIQRYKAFMLLGENAVSNGSLAIKAFKSCETLKGNSREQIALALAKAAERARQLSQSSSTPANEQQAMATETIALYQHLCSAYASTPHGREASYSLADYLYGLKRYAEAATVYKQYFSQKDIAEGKRNQAKLLWCRNIRLNIEHSPAALEKSAPTLSEARKLTAAMLSEDIDSEIKRQTYLEAYRIAATQKDFTYADAMLDTLVADSTKHDLYDTSFWIALYERLLNRYQHNHLEKAEEDAELFLKLHAQLKNTQLEVPYFTVLGDLYARRQKWDKAAEMYRHLEIIVDGKQPQAAAAMNYAMYEAAYCLFMKGDCTTSAQLLDKYFPPNGVSDKHYAYQSAMLQGDIAFADKNPLAAFSHYARAQQVYGNEDTYKTNYAICRQAEMLIVSAENTMSENKGHQADAIRKFEQACEMFEKIIESGNKIGLNDKDHYFDLSIRAQYNMGECYEQTMPKAAAESDSRDAALNCYRRVCSYFVSRHLAGQSIRSAHYYIKSLDKIVKLMTNGNAAVKDKSMQEVAKHFEEYAEMNLPGSEIARKRAELIRKQWGGQNN